jgi:3-phenylpropionate/cinnamic acid dioxygenase small subunit
MSEVETRTDISDPLEFVTPVKPNRREQIPFGQPVYNEVMQFLHEEARLLDDEKLAEWVNLLARDLFYYMPIRQTVLRRQGEGFHGAMNWFHENRMSIEFKVKRYTESNSAFSEDPPSRTRRMVTNMILYATTSPDEFVAESYLLVMRNRGDQANHDLVPARREDLVRRTPEGWRLAQRAVLIDQAVIGTPNLAIFF